MTLSPKYIFVFGIFVCSILGCNSYKHPIPEKTITIDEYKVVSDRELEGHIVLETTKTSSGERVVIVMEKGSTQLASVTDLYSAPIKFSTYSFYDLYALGPTLCYELEGTRIHCTDEEGDLRFVEN